MSIGLVLFEDRVSRVTLFTRPVRYRVEYLLVGMAVPTFWTKSIVVVDIMLNRGLVKQTIDDMLRDEE